LVIDGKPRPANKFVSTTHDARRELAKNGDSGRRPIQAFVSVGRHHERKTRDHSRTDDKETHRLHV
jgi:hypothetical protein